MGFGIERAVAEALVIGGRGGDELVAASFGVFATDIFINEQPESPDDTITILIDGPGGLADLTVSEEIGIKVVTRRGGDSSSEDALERAKDIHRFLHLFQGNVRGVPIAQITALNLPNPLGRDVDTKLGGRNMVSQDFIVLSGRFAFS